MSELLIKLPKYFLSNRLRGGTRLTKFLANNLKTFQSYKVKTNGGCLTIDLRNLGVHHLLVDPMRMTGEHKVMKRFVNVGDTVFDIGANAGLFTVWLSSLVGFEGKVFAFEPNPAHKNSLEKTVLELQNTVFMPVALSFEEGTGNFFIPEDDTMASLTDWTSKQNGSVTKKVCLIKTIDGLINERKINCPDFIKCDIEGGETDCFKGAVNTLNRKDAPLIHFEMNANSAKGYGVHVSSAMDFLAALEKPEYNFFLIEDSGDLKKISSFYRGHGNVLAIPKAKL
jgi:FkbM family methyltransferase